MHNESLTITVKQAASRIGVSHVSLYTAIARGEFPHIKIGHRIVIPIAALKKYLENAGSWNNHV